MRIWFHRKIARLALFASLASLAVPAALAATQASRAPAKPPADEARIDGFRGARFGMDSAEVRRAIERAFHVKAAAIRKGFNPVQRTRVLGVRIRNLLPGIGPATVTYMFGYRSHRLIEVNILWAAKADPKANTPKALETAGATLQAYFEKERFPKDHTVANVALAKGTLILFRGIDAEGHAVVVALNGKISRSDKPKHFVMTPETLSVVYAENPEHPDVFRLKKGSF